METVKVSDGGLENVIVFVSSGLPAGATFATPATPIEINQQNCHYIPHVFTMMTNQQLEIKNSDMTLHNIHAWAEKNPQFNISQPFKEMKTEKSFSMPEIMVHFRCDVHKWMSCYVGVLPHPYYSVTGKDGAFALKSLPPGEYVIEAWHEKYGAKTQKVTVGDKETKEISFSYAAS